VCANAAAVVDHQSEGDEEEAGTEQDKRLETSYAVHDHANANACQSRTEAVEVDYSVGRFIALVEGNSQYEKEEVCLTRPAWKQSVWPSVEPVQRQVLTKHKE
jgi:hypothetical protein